MNDYIEWKKPTARTKLVKEGSVMTEGPGLAEAMMKQYKKKEIEVKEALGEAKGDFLAAGRRITEGNEAVFNRKKVPKKEVEDKIAEVDNRVVW